MTPSPGGELRRRGAAASFKPRRRFGSLSPFAAAVCVAAVLFSLFTAVARCDDTGVEVTPRPAEKGSQDSGSGRKTANFPEHPAIGVPSDTPSLGGKPTAGVRPTVNTRPSLAPEKLLAAPHPHGRFHKATPDSKMTTPIPNTHDESQLDRKEQATSFASNSIAAKTTSGSTVTDADQATSSTSLVEERNLATDSDPERHESMQQSEPPKTQHVTDRHGASTAEYHGSPTTPDTSPDEPFASPSRKNKEVVFEESSSEQFVSTLPSDTVVTISGESSMSPASKSEAFDRLTSDEPPVHKSTAGRREEVLTSDDSPGPTSERNHASVHSQTGSVGHVAPTETKVFLNNHTAKLLMGRPSEPAQTSPSSRQLDPSDTTDPSTQAQIRYDTTESAGKPAPLRSQSTPVPRSASTRVYAPSSPGSSEQSRRFEGVSTSSSSLLSRTSSPSTHLPSPYASSVKELSSHSTHYADEPATPRTSESPTDMVTQPAGPTDSAYTPKPNPWTPTRPAETPASNKGDDMTEPAGTWLTTTSDSAVASMSVGSRHDQTTPDTEISSASLAPSADARTTQTAQTVGAEIPRSQSKPPTSKSVISESAAADLRAKTSARSSLTPSRPATLPESPASSGIRVLPPSVSADRAVAKTTPSTTSSAQTLESTTSTKAAIKRPSPSTVSVTSSTVKASPSSVLKTTTLPMENTASPKQEITSLSPKAYPVLNYPTLNTMTSPVLQTEPSPVRETTDSFILETIASPAASPAMKTAQIKPSHGVGNTTTPVLDTPNYMHRTRETTPSPAEGTTKYKHPVATPKTSSLHETLTALIMGTAVSPSRGTTATPRREARTSPPVETTTSPALETPTSVAGSIAAPVVGSTTSPVQATAAPMPESTSSLVQEPTPLPTLGAASSPLLTTTTSSLIKPTPSTLLEISSTTESASLKATLSSTQTPTKKSAVSLILETTSPAQQTVSSSTIKYTIYHVAETASLVHPTFATVETTDSARLETKSSPVRATTSAPEVKTTTSSRLHTPTSPKMVETSTSSMPEVGTPPLNETAPPPIMRSTKSSLRITTTFPALATTSSPTMRLTTSPKPESTTTTTPTTPRTQPRILQTTKFPTSTTNRSFTLKTTPSTLKTTSPIPNRISSPALQTTASSLTETTPLKLTATSSPVLETTSTFSLGATTSPRMETSSVSKLTSHPRPSGSSSKSGTTPPLKLPQASQRSTSHTPKSTPFSLLQSASSSVVSASSAWKLSTSPAVQSVSSSPDSTTAPSPEITTSALVEAETPSLETTSPSPKSTSSSPSLKSTTSVSESTSQLPASIPPFSGLTTSLTPAETTSVSIKPPTSPLESSTATKFDPTAPFSQSKTSFTATTTLPVPTLSPSPAVVATSPLADSPTSPAADELTTSPLLASTTVLPASSTSPKRDPSTASSSEPRPPSAGQTSSSDPSTLPVPSVSGEAQETTFKTVEETSRSTVKPFGSVSVIHNASQAEATASLSTTEDFGTDNPVDECRMHLDNCDHLTEVCADTKDLYRCDCRQGYFRIETGTCIGGRSFYGRFEIDAFIGGDNKLVSASYSPELRDPASASFLELSANVQSTIDLVYRQDHRTAVWYRGCQVIRFGSGSIVTEFQLILDWASSSNQSTLQAALFHAVDNGTLLTQGGLVVPVDSVHVTPLDECAQDVHDCSEHAACHDQPSGFSCVCSEGYRDLYQDVIPGRYCQPVTRPTERPPINEMLFIVAIVSLASAFLLVAFTISTVVVCKNWRSRRGSVTFKGVDAAPGATAPRKISDSFLAGADAESGVWCPGDEQAMDSWTTGSASSTGQAPSSPRVKNGRMAPIANISELEFDIGCDASLEDERRTVPLVDDDGKRVTREIALSTEPARAPAKQDPRLARRHLRREEERPSFDRCPKVPLEGSRRC